MKEEILINQLDSLVSPLKADFLVISQAQVQEFWIQNNLDKKIKKIISSLSLHHPRAIASAAQTIQRLIVRQNVPASWQLKKQAKCAHISVYLGNSEIGSSDWLPNYNAPVSPPELGRVIKQSLGALYHERFIRERLQRGWSQHHLPITVVATLVDKIKTVDPEIIIHTVHPDYHNSAIAQLVITTKGQRHDYSIFKPAFATKKALVLNKWHDQIISEDSLRTIFAPILDLEKKNGTIKISGILNKIDNSVTVLRLETEAQQNKEELCQYVLSNTSQALATGEWLGQGIAVGALLIDRAVQTQKVLSSGNIIVAKNLNMIAQTAVNSAVGFIVEETVDTARVTAKTKHINVPILARVKNATKKFRSGTMVTVAATENNEGVVYSGALPYEVTPIVRVAHKTKTEIRPTKAQISIDELIGLSGAHHPLDYFSKKNNHGKIYTELLGQALAVAVAEQYPARLTVAFSNSLSRVFTHWAGGKSAENKLHLRSNARGAERYLAKQYEPVLAAECAAFKQVREKFGFTEMNIKLPYCRSSVELEEIITAIGKYGLTRSSGWRFSLATDLPGHAILTSALAKHLDELVFDIDSLVKSTTGTRSTVITPTHQKTVEHALAAIAKAARKERARVALSGALLASEPKLVWSAVKSGIKTLVVKAEEESAVRATAWQAERTVGYGGANSRWLGTMVGVASLGVLLITVGAGCGQRAPAIETPQITPAQIRAEIMTALEAQKNSALQEKTTATVTGFANFNVAHPRNFAATYSPDDFTLSSEMDKLTLKFSAISKFGTSSSTDFVTDTKLPGKLFAYPNESEPLYIYEVELTKNKILKIESATTSEAIMEIVKSVQTPN